MSLPTASASYHRNRRRFSKLRAAALLVLAAAMAVTLLPPPPAEAYYTEGTQTPGTVNVRNEGSPGSSNRFKCGSTTDPLGSGGTLWRKESNNVWRVEIPEYPWCTGVITVVTDPSNNTLEDFTVGNPISEPPRDVDDGNPTADTGNAGDHLTCTKYVEVLRFYGPANDPARHVTRSVAEPAVKCVEVDGIPQLRGQLSRVGLTTPHPHDAGVNPSGSFYRSTPTYATTGPLSEAWQPQSAGSRYHCPRPDDPSNLRRFFTTSGWETPEEEDLARNVRQGFAGAYADIVSRTRAAGLPDSVALGLFNAAGLERYSGDGFTTLDYSDRVPCSSPLDFTVPHDNTPWVYGVCAAPVVTSYRGPIWARGEGRPVNYNVVESYPDVVDERGYGRHLPDYGVEDAQSWFGESGLTPSDNDSVTRAYRNRAASILGRTDQFAYSPTPNRVGRASQMAANLPCAYGQGPVEPEEVVVEAREPVDPIAITGPRSGLAYVGGERTAQRFVFRPEATITCRGGRGCTQGQTIHHVSYAPRITVPAGWTACRPGNHASCDYRWEWSRRGNDTLVVDLETFTATRQGEAIRIIPRGTIVVEWPALQTDGGNLSFSIVHTASGFSSALNLNTTINIPMAPGSSRVLAPVSSRPRPAAIQVAGSRLGTLR